VEPKNRKGTKCQKQKNKNLKKVRMTGGPVMAAGKLMKKSKLKKKSPKFRKFGMTVKNMKETPALKPLIYLASPYSHPDARVKESRFKAAVRAATWLMGCDPARNVFSPIVHSHPLHKLGGLRGDWKFWSKIDREYLTVSHKLIVLLLDGWKESVGVQAELDIANDLDIPVGFLWTVEGRYRLYD
jgi:hypothetical protein